MGVDVVLDTIVVDQRVVDVEQKNGVVHGAPSC
jgi:hypothetical protein